MGGHFAINQFLLNCVLLKTMLTLFSIYIIVNNGNKHYPKAIKFLTYISKDDENQELVLVSSHLHPHDCESILKGLSSPLLFKVCGKQTLNMTTYKTSASFLE